MVLLYLCRDLSCQSPGEPPCLLPEQAALRVGFACSKQFPCRAYRMSVATLLKAGVRSKGHSEFTVALCQGPAQYKVERKTLLYTRKDCYRRIFGARKDSCRRILMRGETAVIVLGFALVTLAHKHLQYTRAASKTFHRQHATYSTKAPRMLRERYSAAAIYKVTLANEVNVRSDKPLSAYHSHPPPSPN